MKNVIMKKTFLVLSMCIFLLIFVSSSLAIDESIKFMWWQDTDVKVAGWQAEFERFEAETGINVEVELLGWSDMFQKLTISFATENPEYDVCYVPTNWLYKYASNNYLEPLNDRITPEMSEQYISDWKEIVSYKGKIYGLPKVVGPRIMYYNKEILQEAGIEKIPSTWDELVEAIRIISNDTDYDGFTAALNGDWLFYLFVAAMNGSDGQLFTEDGAAAFNNAKGLKAVNFLEELARYGPESAFEWENTRLSNNYFLKGYAGITFAEVNLWPSTNDEEISNVVGKVGYDIVPGDGVNARSGTRTVIESMAISSFSKNKDAAWKFIKWLTTDIEHVNNVFDVIGYLPATKEFYEIKETPFLKTINEQLSYTGVSWDNSPDAPEIMDVIMVELQSVLLGAKDAQQALNDAEKKVNALRGISN